MPPIADGGAVFHKDAARVDVSVSRGSLASRILLVAVVSVLCAMVSAMAVAYPLVTRAASNQAREELARQADVVADLVRRSLSGQVVDGRGEIDDRRGPQRDVVIVAVTEDSIVAAPLTQSDVEAVTEGNGISIERDINGEVFFIEGRNVADDRGILLIKRAELSSGSANSLLIRMGLALLTGLVIALVLALWVARRTAAPMRDAAQAASQLAHGKRDVVVAIEGPVEVVDIANAINELSRNLAISENRQREFFMSISHELRTPMTAVRGYAEALADGVIQPEEISNTGEILVQETGRLDRLIADLLDLARAGAVDFHVDRHDMDVAEVIRRASDSWKLRAAKDNIQVTLSSCDSAIINADATRIRQIIDNLMENALRVTPEGGEIEIGCLIADGVVEIFVDDSGPGLTPEDMDTAFLPGHLTAKYRGVRPVGTGLGLALVGSLAQRMDGRARAELGTKGGARFSVTFPPKAPRATTE